MSKRKDLTIFFIDSTAGVEIRYDQKDGAISLQDGPQLKRFADELKKQADHLFLLYQSSCLEKQLKSAKLYHVSVQKMKDFDHDVNDTLKAFKGDWAGNKYEA